MVHPAEFDVAIAYLIRRLEEGASSENFMSAVFELSKNERLFEREKQRFLASLEALDDDVPEPSRQQDRTEPEPARPSDSFDNIPDTDPSLPANLAWGREILARVPASTLGRDTVAAAQIGDEAGLEQVIAKGVAQSRAGGP